MKIGKINIDNALFLAPMAGITDHPFRIICKEMGASIVYTEFVSANGIIRENLKTFDFVCLKSCLILIPYFLNVRDHYYI